MATRARPADAGVDVEGSVVVEPVSRPAPRWSVVDVVVAVVLVVAAIVARRHVLPRDGLFGDDAWQAFGAMHASPSNFLTVGFSGPGFTALLSVWHSIVHRPEALSDVAFAAGVLAGALTYLVLRGFGTDRAISLLVGSALVAERVNIIYSGRVKSYVIDALIVLALAAIIPRLAGRTWNVRVTLAWLIGAVLVGLFSPFALVAALVGGAVLVVRPRDDLGCRVVGVGAQAVVYGVVTLAVRRTYGVTLLQRWWQDTYDGFVVSHSGPFGIVSQTFVHLRRVAIVFSGGPSWWATICLLATVGALVLDALVRDRTPRTLRAQYLVLLLVAALVGGVTKVVPFGPRSDGMRLSLWLVPIFAIGAARALTRLRDVAQRRVAAVIFDAVAIIVATLIVLSATTDSPRYPETGAQSATNFVEQRLTPSTIVFVELGGVYPYAVATHLPVAVHPHRAKVAFIPQFNDSRIHYLAFTGATGANMLLTSPQDERRQHDVVGVIGNANEVVLYLIPNTVIDRGATAFASLMRDIGFGSVNMERFQNAVVLTWNRTT